MTGNIKLLNIISEILYSIGHQKDEYRGSFHINQDNPNSKFTIWVKTNPTFPIGMNEYELEIDNINNTVKVIPGPWKPIDFHEPDSVILLKTILVQMPIYCMLKNIRNSLDKILTNDNSY